MTITSIEKHKKKKKYLKVVEDFKKILTLFSLTQKGLYYFKNYVVVQEVMSVLETNKTFIEIRIRFYEEEIKKLENENGS